MFDRDIDLIRLAREIAIDHYDIEIVLDRYKLDYDRWGALLQYPRFAALLASEEEAWNTALNTTQRVKLKAAAVIENYLESAHAALHDEKEGLVAKTGLAKLVASFAGIGGEDYQKRMHVGEGNGFSITINLGDRSLNFTPGSDGEEGEGEGEGEGEELELEVTGLPAIATSEEVYAVNADLDTPE